MEFPPECAYLERRNRVLEAPGRDLPSTAICGPPMTDSTNTTTLFGLPALAFSTRRSKPTCPTIVALGAARSTP